MAPYVDASQSGVVTLSYVFGKPVIVSNSGGLPEQVLDGKTGIIINKGDIEALTEAIISLYNDKDRLVDMKKSAVEMSNTVTWNNTAKSLLKRIQDYLDKKTLD